MPNRCNVLHPGGGGRFYAVRVLAFLPFVGCSLLLDGDSATPSDGGPMADADDAVDGAMTCPDLLDLSDDFAAFDSSRWSVFDVLEAETSVSEGFLKVALGPNQSSFAGGGLTSTRSDYSLIGRRLFVRIEQMANIAAPISVSMILTSAEPPLATYRIRQLAGFLRFDRTLDGGVQEILAMTNFSLATHRFWQLRVTDNVLYAEAGPTLSELTVLGTDAIESNEKRRGVENVSVLLLAESTEVVADPGEAQFDDLNIGCAGL